MSTQTKIKGVIVNDDLPVLTADGLVSKVYLDYVDALAGKGYTMSETQRAAVISFLSSLSEYGLTEYILTMFPFICSPSKRGALSVPLIGVTPFGSVADSWLGAVVDGDDVIGVNNNPVTDLTTLGGLVPAANFFGVAGSFIKGNTENAAAYNDRILYIPGKFGLRVQKLVDGTHRVGVSYMQDGNDVFTAIPAPDVLPLAGCGYALAMFRTVGYVRYCKFNDGAIFDGSEIEEYRPPRFSAADLATSMSSAGSTETVWTSATTFKKLMTKEQAERYMQILETFMSALGRTA